MWIKKILSRVEPSLHCDGTNKCLKSENQSDENDSGAVLYCLPATPRSGGSTGPTTGRPAPTEAGGLLWLLFWNVLDCYVFNAYVLKSFDRILSSRTPPPSTWQHPLP